MSFIVAFTVLLPIVTAAPSFAGGCKTYSLSGAYTENNYTINGTVSYGLYYPDAIFRSNVSVLFTRPFLPLHAEAYQWYGAYKDQGVSINYQYSYLPHPFKDGIAVKIFHRVREGYTKGFSTPAAYLFGSTFDSNSSTLLIGVNGTHRIIAVCQFVVCKSPLVHLYPYNQTTPPDTFTKYYLEGLFSAADNCSLLIEQPLWLDNSTNSNRLVTAQTQYIFTYESGVFSVYHAHNPNGSVGYATLAFTIPVTIPITKFYLPAVFDGLKASGDNGVKRGNYHIEFAYLKRTTYMFTYDGNGYITSHVYCAEGPLQELKCSQLSNNVPPGVYRTTNYRAEPQGHVVRYAADVADFQQSCGAERLLNASIDQIPDPAFWKRHVIRNCKFNFSHIMALSHVYDMQCYGIDASKLPSTCWNEVYADVFRLAQDDFYSFKPSASGDLATYNYKLPSDFLGCTLILTNPNLYCGNSTTCGIPGFNGVTGDLHYKVWRPGTTICPMKYVNPGEQNAMGYHCMSPTEHEKKLTPVSFRGGYYYMYGLALTLKPATVASTVCDVTAQQTNLTLDKCVSYTVYGYNGQGILVETNETFPSFQNVQLWPNGQLKAFKDPQSNQVIAVLPCAEADVSVATAGNHTNEVATLFTGAPCSGVQAKLLGVSTTSMWRRISENTTKGIDTPVGCLFGAVLSTSNSTECQFSLGLDTCLNITRGRVGSRSAGHLKESSTYNYFFQDMPKESEIPFSNFTVEIPDNFTIAIEYETLPIRMSKISVDCSRYVCGTDVVCANQLVQYGKFCDNINEALRGVSLQQDSNVAELLSDIKQLTRVSDLDLKDINGFNFSSLYNTDYLDATSSGRRSAIEDLLFNKVVTADVGFMKKYEECTGGSVFKDLDCAQSFNGLKVLPPQMSDAHVGVYTTAAAMGSFFSIPNTMQMAYRFNGIAVTQSVLVDNQKEIANKFNQALTSIQQGFTATNSAVQKLQDVVNANAAALNTLVTQLGNNFGAISSAINDITQRLDKLEAAVQIDRLINGRLQVLQTFVTQQLIMASEIRASAQLAKQKMSECVLSQSKRQDFCGRGLHLMSFPQSAPQGMVFLHVLYRPTSYINVTSTPAICSENKAYFPTDGVFVLHDNQWMITKRNFYDPVNISLSNVRYAGSCDVITTYANHTIFEPDNSTLQDFMHELEEIRKNLSMSAPNSPNFTLPGLSDINASFVDLSKEMETLQNVVRQLNKSVIDLKELGTYEYYEKWPWYIWLGFIAGLVAIALVLVLICCSTSCCSCFKGMCSCKKCCDSYDDDEQILIKQHYP
uniref:Spike glycoprotein n=1 Tax=Zaria bat coronavirus TaxID=989337 RepID=F1BYL9_9BETC|nr:putative spike glycoprotein [Zaria bat coronavirus]